MTMKYINKLYINGIIRITLLTAEYLSVSLNNDKPIDKE